LVLVLDDYDVEGLSEFLYQDGGFLSDVGGFVGGELYLEGGVDGAG